MKTEYGFGITLDVPIASAIERVTSALKAEGFGILSDIDVQQTLRNKLGAEVAPYRILGACNPQLARRALELDPDIGLLLPCNVVVRAEGAHTRVEIIDPEAMMSVAGTEGLKAVAAEAKQRLQRVVAALGGESLAGAQASSREG